MLSGFRDVLEERRAAGAAAGSFTCYDVTTACGVVHAAEAAGVPVVLLVSEASVASRDGRLLLPALGAIARVRPRARLRPARPCELAGADPRSTGERCSRRRASRRLEASLRGQRRVRVRRPRSCPQPRSGDRGRAGSRRGRGGRGRRCGCRQADRSGGGGGVRRGDGGLVPGGVDRERARHLRRRARARLAAAGRDPGCSRRPALAPRRLGAAGG